MKFTLTIKVDNAAFEDEGRNKEVAGILGKLAQRMHESPSLVAMRLLDVNGNHVGDAHFEASDGD